MNIIVISLARAGQRRAQMNQRLRALGLSFEFLDATDGANLTADQLARVDHTARRWITAYPLTNNEIGCYFSHLRAIAQIAESGAPMGVILEDDVTLSADLPLALEAIAARALPFDVITLHRTLKKGEIFAVCAPLLPDLTLGRVGYTHINLQGYVVSRQGARKILAHMRRIGHAVDKELHRYWANGIDLYGLSRAVVTHADEGYSMIDETRGGRSTYPDAGQLRWRLARFITKVRDSVAKRLAFPAFVKAGQASHRNADRHRNAD